MLESIVIILGLIVFEVISSVDNAIVNAHVLKTLPDKFRKIFLVWGLLWKQKISWIFRIFFLNLVRLFFGGLEILPEEQRHQEVRQGNLGY